MKSVIIRIGLLLLLLDFSIRPAVFESAEFIGENCRTNSLLQPKKIAIGLQLEITTYTLLAPLIPNLAVKYPIQTTGSWKIAAKTTGYYPTVLCRLLQRKGAGGVISPETNLGLFPPLVVVKQMVIFTAEFHGIRFSPFTEMTLGFRSPGFDDRLIIDHPLVYSMMTSAAHGPSWSAGLSVEKSLNVNWTAATRLQYLRTGDRENRNHLQHSLIFSRKLSNKYSLRLGYSILQGEFPFGEQWYLIPLLDLQWDWEK